MAFLKEPVPAYGVPIEAAAGIRRIVAPNPSVMTFHGTNSWLIEAQGGTWVLDPGPAIDSHVQSLLDATGGRIAGILLSHFHADHTGASDVLRSATGAAVHSWHVPHMRRSIVDYGLQDGDAVAGLVAVHTPGHASDHLCFARADGILLTADHVMGWASSIVSPPDGNMAAYFASLQRLLDRHDPLYLCGHGPAIEDPQAHVRSLLHHRRRREHAILQAVQRAPADTYTLMDRLYSKVDPMLRRAAERNVVAHLEKLLAEGRVIQAGPLWQTNP